MLPDGNYLFAEEEILKRLGEKMPDVFIDSIGDSEHLVSAKHRFPGVYVLYAGDEVSERTAGAGKASQAVQHWIIVAGAKDTETLSTGQKSRKTVGTLIYTVLKALQGFEVAPEMKLVRTSCSVPIMYENGYIFKAVEFILTVNVVGG